MSFLLLFSQNKDKREVIKREYDLNKLISLSNVYKAENANSKARAISLGFAEEKVLADGRIAQLQRLNPFNKPIYYVTNNTGAALTTRANKVNTGGGLGLDLNGQNMIVGVWDGGPIRQTHQLVIGRVDQRDGIVFSSSDDNNQHALHVSGTMIGSNTANPSAQGMAYQANLWAHDWNDDDAEMALAASEGLLLSNHSYGVGVFDGFVLQIDKFWFGKYEAGARKWDEIMYNAPYYLAVDAAGNDRQKAFFATNKGGYDMLVGTSTNKNGICVAGVEEVANYTDPSSVIDYNASNWGGTDDGRVKPDISAKAVNVFSSTSESDIQYSTYSGTSMATPGITGTLTLLQQHYNELYGSFMRSATLKGLALHTADEAGLNLGPDFAFGWGLMNAEKAAIALSQRGIESIISEEVLNEGETFTITVEANPTETLMASICWTDPAGTVFISPNDAEMLDNPIPALVNDLDIRITKNENTYYPWKLQPPIDEAAASAAATKGDNTVDNMEKVEVENPNGSYTITINHKGNLDSSSQNFSLIVTGIKSEFTVNSTNGDFKEVCAPDDAVYELNFLSGFSFSGSATLSVTNLPASLTATLSQNTISADGPFTLTVSDLANTDPGQYDFQVVAENGGETISKNLSLWVLHNSFTDEVVLTAPTNNSIGLERPVLLSWTDEPNAQTYLVEIATDDAFSNIVGSTNVSIESFNSDYFSGIEDDTQYYWRVKPINDCGEGAYSSTFNFKTVGYTCNSNQNNTIVSIPTTPSDIPYTSTTSITENISIDRVKVHIDLTHTWTGDLTITLISPNGTEVILSDNNCSGDEYENFNVTYSDFGSDLVCSASPPAISGTIKPMGSLSDFNSENTVGDWTLSILDPHDQDGGSLNSWDLIICESNTVGISDFSFNNFSLWPNPANDFINIRLDANNTNNYAVELFDMLGRNIYSKLYPHSDTLTEQINVEKLSKGVYFVKVSQGDKYQTEKLIIE